VVLPSVHARSKQFDTDASTLSPYLPMNESVLTIDTTETAPGRPNQICLRGKLSDQIKGDEADRHRGQWAAVSPSGIHLRGLHANDPIDALFPPYASGEGRLAGAWFGGEAALLKSSLRAQLAAQHEPSDGIDRPGASSSLE